MSDIEISVQNSVLMNPENILADIEYFEEVPDETSTGNIAIASSDGNLLSITLQEEPYQTTTVIDSYSAEMGAELIGIDDGSYELIGLLAFLMAIRDCASIAGHRIYIGFDLSNTIKNLYLAFYVAQIVAEDVVQKVYAFSSETNRISLITEMLEGISYMDFSGGGYAIRKTGTSAFIPSSLAMTHPIIVDITANAATFSALGLSTDEEIKSYLDNLDYEDFGQSVRVI